MLCRRLRNASVNFRRSCSRVCTSSSSLSFSSFILSFSFLIEPMVKPKDGGQKSKQDAMSVLVKEIAPGRKRFKEGGAKWTITQRVMIDT